MTAGRPMKYDWRPGTARDSLNPFPPLPLVPPLFLLWATPASFRTSASSLSDEFSLVNNTRWSSLSVLKKRIDGPSHLKKEDSIPKGGQAGIAKKKVNFLL